MQKSRRPILLTGGGSLGPVTPLLGIYEAWKRVDPEQPFVWIGTPNGPEETLVRKAGIPFRSVWAPKAPRYFTWRWVLFPFLLLWSLAVSGWLLARLRPSWVISAGAYVSVPFAWLAPLFGTRVAIHQLDYTLGMSNRLMAPMASLVTSTFEVTKQQLPKKRVEVIGALAYGAHLVFTSREEALRHFDLQAGKPTLLVLGGGTGSLAMNRACEQLADQLVLEWNVLHATGPGKRIFESRRAPDTYYVTDLFVEDFGQALGLADVVLTRAGLGTLIELVEKKKAAVLVPMPHSPQEENARAVEAAGAARVLEDASLEKVLQKTLREVMEPSRKRELERRMGSLFPLHGAEQFVKLIQQKNTPG